MWLIQTLVVLILYTHITFCRQVHSQVISTLTANQLEQLAFDSHNLTLEGSLLQPLLQPRVSGTAENKKVQEFIISTLKALDFNIELDRFTAETPLGQKEFTNIIATKNPNAKRKLVLAAHFDSKYFNNEAFVGATDSSVPCAILLDIAHSLNSHFKPRDTIETLVYPTLQLIFFDGEEAFVQWSATDSLYGSRHLAEKWANTFVSDQNDFISGILNTNQMNQMASRTMLQTIDALVLLDLLGTDDCTIYNTHAETDWAWDRLVDIEQRLSSSKFLSKKLSSKISANEFGFFVPEREHLYSRGGIDDDHRPFKELGVPIVHVIPQPFPKVWHSTRDDASALSPDAIQDMAKIFRVFTAEYLGLFL